MFWGRVTGNIDNAEARARLSNDPTLVSLPPASLFLASVVNILSESMGFRLSAEADAGRQGDGAKMPMLSYGLVEYLMGLDLSGFDLLEIGGGDSTAFWAERTRSVLTLETNVQWAEGVRRQETGADVRLVQPGLLPATVAGLDRTFGVIVIDAAANRLACARAAVAKLQPGGFMILDNSDWYPNAAAVLREAGLIQVDFHDFRPARPYRATASLFLSPTFRPKPAEQRLPKPPIGGKFVSVNYWDQD